MTARWLARTTCFVNEGDDGAPWRSKTEQISQPKGTVMTSITETSTATTERDRARRAVVPVAVGSFLVAAFLDLARADSAGEALSMVAFGLIVVSLLYPLVVVRSLRSEDASGRALALGIVGLLLIVPAFWSGLPMILGAAAALLGYAGRRAETGSGKATAAFVLGTLSMVGYVASYVTDWVANPGATWWS